MVEGERHHESMAKLTLEPDDLLPALVEALQHTDVRRALGLDERAPAAPPKYAPPAEYADRLRVSERSIRKWQRRGLPVVRIGSVVRVRVAEADAWLEEGGAVRAATLRTLRAVQMKHVPA